VDSTKELNRLIVYCLLFIFYYFYYYYISKDSIILHSMYKGVFIQLNLEFNDMNMDWKWCL
jgi:hypothetical protein